MKTKEIILIILLIIIIVILGVVMAKKVSTSKQQESNTPYSTNEVDKQIDISNNIGNYETTNNTVTENETIQNTNANLSKNNVVELGEDIFNASNKATENAVPKMEKAAQQAFNSTFNAYEGNQKSSSIKNLIQSVTTNNLTQPEHQVSMEYNGKSYTESSELINLRDNIVSSKIYNVSTKYDKDGYINKIIITEQ